jgi:hypothetical protein
MLLPDFYKTSNDDWRDDHDDDLDDSAGSRMQGNTDNVFNDDSGKDPDDDSDEN